MATSWFKPKNLLLKFVRWANNWMNTDHQWMDYEAADKKMGNLIDSVSRKTLGTGLTAAEQEANAFSAQEAEKNRQWEEYMSSTAYQRQVTDMRAAGVNPAMAMSSSSGASTPSGVSASSVSPDSGISMSDLMQIITLPLQMKSLKAQTENTMAKTENTMADTELTKLKAENMALVNQYYPSVTEAGLEKTLSEVGLNLATIDKIQAQTALINVQKLLADKENKYAEQFYKARAAYEEAKTEEAKSAAVRNAAEALMTGYEYEYAKENGAKLSSSSVLALVSAIGSFTGLTSPPVRSAVQSVIKPMVSESSESFGMFKGAYNNLAPKVKKGISKFERWRNKPKKIFGR